MLILADIALSFDDQLAEAYVIRGDYYELNYEKEQAINEYDKAIKLNPNYWRAYWEKGGMYLHDDLVKTIDNYQKAASLQRGPFLPEIYRWIGFAYVMAGFKEKSIYYAKEALKLDDDSAAYYSFLAEIEDCFGNFEKAIEFGKKSYALDSTDWWVIYLLGLDHLYLGQFDEYFKYFKKYETIVKTLDRPHPWGTFRLGHAYWVNGFKEEAEYYFNTGLEFHNEMIELGRHYFQDFITFYNLASIYAFLGDKEKAYENLRVMNQRQKMPLWMIKDLNNDPLFDSIRDELEFQQIVRDVEAKYQAEHERVRKWLDENDML
jgi:tetratricopeptide (TPR) repeat protein